MNSYLSVETLLIAGFIFEYRKINILGGKGFSGQLEEKHRSGLVTKEIWLCIHKHTML